MNHRYSALGSRPWPVRMSLFRPYTIWGPTCTGWTIIFAIVFVITAVCVINSESFLAPTDRLPADILVVEGWIGRKGISAAVNEFKQGGYRYIVASGGLTSGRWGEDEPESYAQMAANEIARLGVPKEHVLAACSEDTESHRTFESAVAVRRTLALDGIEPKTINVFTFGPHARRSELVFQKVNSGGPEVGVISWFPEDDCHKPWWRSSERSRGLLEEIFGYIYEALLNSGRRSNSAEKSGPR